MVNGLGAKTFGTWPSCWNDVLDQIKHSEKTGLLTPIQMPSQETFNTHIVSKQFQFRARVRICSRTELKEPFGKNKEVWLIIFSDWGWASIWFNDSGILTSESQRLLLEILVWTRRSDLGTSKLTIFEMKTQKSLQTKVVGNFLSLPMVTHATIGL
jgi:hypothetical protein